MLCCFVSCQSGTAEEEWRGGLEEQDQQETGGGEGGVHRAAGSAMGDGGDLPEEGQSDLTRSY